MKKLIYILIILLFASNISFANISNTDLFLYCNNVGADSYKYDLMVKQSLLTNSLQLNKEQQEKLDLIFNNYSSEYANLSNELNENKEQYQKMKKDKTSLSCKIQQKNKIKCLKKQTKSLTKKMDKETKKILTRKQRSKYNTLKKNIF